MVMRIRKYVNHQEGSFTVEATFVVNLVIWIILSICYLSYYSHDVTVAYSLGQGCLERGFSNGADKNEGEIQEAIRSDLSKCLMICKLQNIEVKKQLTRVDVRLHLQLKIHFPFIRQLLTGTEGKIISLSYERLFAPHALWDLDDLEAKNKGNGGKLK